MTTPARIVRPVLVAAVAVADDVLVLREAWQRALELGHTLVVCSVVAEDHARPAAEAWLRDLIAGLGDSAVQVEIDVRVGDRADPVLGATDLGDPTWPVLRAAVTEGNRASAPVLVVNCVTTPPMTVTDGIAAPIVSVDELTRSAGGVLAAAAIAVGLPPSETRVEFGAPAEIVVRMAAELDARMVVIGSHGGSGAARFLLGSVAETILRQVPCTVMVVPLNRGGEAASAA